MNMQNENQNGIVTNLTAGLEYSRHVFCVDRHLKYTNSVSEMLDIFDRSLYNLSIYLSIYDELIENDFNTFRWLVEKIANVHSI